MKKLIVLILLAFLLSCEQPVIEDPEPQVSAQAEEVPDETVPEPQNIPPFVKIEQDNCSIANGSSICLQLTIIDLDNDEISIQWKVDGQPAGTAETLTFSASPETMTDYLISVTVSDGEAADSDGITVTVLEPPWYPEPLHFYVFRAGAEQCAENILQEYIADASTYDAYVSGLTMDIEIHNRDYPADPWLFVAGPRS